MQFGISPQAVNKDAGSKIFFNCFFCHRDKPFQIASYEQSKEAGAEGAEDNSRFFIDAI